MPRLLAQVLLFVAVLMAPLGMTAAPAAPAHHGMASMAMEHCPDRQQGPEKMAGIADCAMACAAALPTVSPSQSGPLAVYAPSDVPSVAVRLNGRYLEIATPPPKRS